MDLASLCRWCTPGSKGLRSIAIAGRGPVVRIQLPPPASHERTHRLLQDLRSSSIDQPQEDLRFSGGGRPASQHGPGSIGPEFVWCGGQTTPSFPVERGNAAPCRVRATRQ
jgi:hypothetical protein